MAITTTDLQALGQELIDAGDEASVRAGISRLYYAAYHSTQSWHTALPVPGSLGTGQLGGMHAQLIARLRNPASTLSNDTRTKSRRLSALMTNAHTRRVTADYKLTESIGNAEAAAHQREVQAILELSQQ